jgi:predicted nucleic acid-binding protein
MSLVVVDTSVWARVTQPAVARLVIEAIEREAVAMPVSVLLELLRSARNLSELEALRDEYGQLHALELSESLGRRALEVQAALCARGYHRAPSPADLLTAAAAESVGAQLWHCDRDFELIAELTGQPVRRVGR